MLKNLTSTAAVLLTVFLLGCGAGGGGGGGTEPEPVPPVVVLRPGQQSILTGDTLQVSAVGSAGTELSAAELTWTSSAPEIATVDPSGRVIALTEGSATITGTHDGASGKAVLTVIPGSGQRVPQLASYDSIIPRVMKQWGIPGGAIAVVKDGRLVLARGYGWADIEDEEEVQPDALFRIASVSKPITSAAILKLYEEGRLDLDAKAFDILSDLEPPPGATVDPRLSGITIRQLLYHAGGWDRDASFDPMFRPQIAADAVGAPAPASAETVIRYMLGQPLQFDPGSRYAYSNFGYAVLGRVIERTSGMTYEEYVTQNVLAPLGIDRMSIGHSLPFDRPADEVSYYADGSTESVFPGGGIVPWPDGGFYLEAMDSHGAWIASTVDLLRFLTSVDRIASRPDFLTTSTTQLMIARPAPPLWTGSSYYYAMGWLIRPVDAEANWWHNGSLPGTSALLVRAHNGLAWAALFNARASSQAGSFDGALDQAMWQAAESVTQWPTHDLFTQFD